MAEITWGDTVRVKVGAGPPGRSGAIASVCGIAEVRSAEHAASAGCAVRTTVYLIEFSDGSSTEVAADLLVKLDGPS